MRCIACCICTETDVSEEHVKGLLENARPQALEKYTRLIQTIRNGANIAPHIPKSTSSITHRATYLCLQCPNVATSEDRGQHKKDHLFCKSTRETFIGRTYTHRT